MLNFTTTILILTVVINLSLTPFIYPRRNAGPMHAAFVLATLGIAAWALTLVGFLQIPSDSLALIFLRLSYMAAAFIAACFYYFSIAFPDGNRPSRRHVATLVALTGAVCLAVLVPGFLTGSISLVGGTRTVELHVLGYAAFVGMFCGLFALVQIRVWRKFASAQGIARIQLLLMAICITAVGWLGVYFDLILPSPFLENFRYVWTGPVFTDLFAAVTTYAIFRYRLFNAKALIGELLVFALWLILFVRVLTSGAAAELIGNIVVLALSVPIGVLLIRSLQIETRGREALAVANTKLRELDQLKSEFLSLAAHQLRTPVTLLQGYLSTIEEGDYGPVPEPMRTPITRATETVRGFASMIQDYLDVARIEQNRMTYSFATADLEKIVVVLVDEFTALAKRKALALTFKKDSAGPYRANLDVEKVRQVVSNLLDNAIKYTPSGMVEVALSHDIERGILRLSIADTGTGIDPSTLSKLFQKFSRGDHDRLNTGGSGLGLYVARQFIEAHHRSIWAESTGLGRGSRFIIEVPATAESPTMHGDTI
jgi:signal transduction histidine kinase